MSTIENLEKMLASGQDSALLRYSLGTACMKEGLIDKALLHLQQAVTQDPAYSAAWKAYGKALADAGEVEKAIEVYARGIEVAEARGDLQAAKEMRVFQKRLLKSG